MRAIVGVFALDARPLDASALPRMRAAALLPLSEPHLENPDLAVWFEGRLDNGDDFGCEGSAASLVAAAYRHHGEDVARHLNGDFAAAIVDRTRRRAVLARDVMASEPLYYCPLPGVLLFASEIKCLLAHPDVSVSIDDDVLAEFVVDYWCDAHRTCFKGIFSVPPGEAVIATGGYIQRRTQWTFDPMRQIRHRSFDDYRDHFRSLFEQAVRRRLRGSDRVAIAVSGGLDSSAIFCQAAELKRKKCTSTALHGISITFPAGTAADERCFLDDLDHRWMHRMRRVPISAYEYLQPSDVIVRRLDTPGVVDREEVALFEAARAAGCNVLLSGFFGDQIVAESAYFYDLARRGRWLKLRRHLRVCGAWMTDVEPGTILRDFCGHLIRRLPPRWLFRLGKQVVRRTRLRTRYPPWFTDAFCRKAEARALSRFDQARRGASAHAERYYLHATAGHYVNFVRSDRTAAQAYDIDVRYPFRDRDLVEFLMAIPGDIVNWQGVPKGLLRHALADLLPASVRDRRWKADFTPFENDATKREAARVASMLTPHAASVRAGIVKASSGRQLAAAYAGLNDAAGPLPGWRLGDLIGVEVWLQQHLDAVK